MLEARKNSVLLAEKHVGSLSALQVRDATVVPLLFGFSPSCPVGCVDCANPLCTEWCHCLCGWHLVVTRIVLCHRHSQEALHALGGECAVSRDDFSQVATTLAGLQRTVLAMNAQQVQQFACFQFFVLFFVLLRAPQPALTRVPDPSFLYRTASTPG